jgi:hypothetical protein
MHDLLHPIQINGDCVHVLEALKLPADSVAELPGSQPLELYDGRLYYPMVRLIRITDVEHVCSEFLLPRHSLSAAIAEARRAERRFTFCPEIMISWVGNELVVVEKSGQSFFMWAVGPEGCGSFDEAVLELGYLRKGDSYAIYEASSKLDQLLMDGQATFGLH